MKKEILLASWTGHCAHKDTLNECGETCGEWDYGKEIGVSIDKMFR